MTEAEFRRLARQWQRRLGLQRWTISVYLEQEDDEDFPRDPLTGLPAGGFARVVWGELSAVVGVLHPDHPHARNAVIDFDPEIALVHELLHIESEPIREALPLKPPTSREHLEQYIETTARVLVGLSREAQRK